MNPQTKFKETEIGKIPEDWEIDQLKNHLVIKGRIGWKGLKIAEYICGGPYIVGGLQIVNGQVNWEECSHVTDERYNESPEIMLKIDDILITKDGTIGKLAYIDLLTDKSTVASHIHVVRIKSSKIYPKYLYYFFSSPRFRALMESSISGSVVPALTQKDINNLYMPIPSLPEQKSIANILSSLDLKIKINQQMNKTLESIGQALFKHWFIDFEFPDKDGKPYKSSSGDMVYSEEFEKKVPKGWEVAHLGDKLELCYGEGLPARKRKKGPFPVVGSNGIVGYHNEYLVIGPGIVIGRKGTLGSVHWINDDFYPIDTTFYISSKIDVDELYYFYFLLKGKEFLKLSSDSAVPGLNKNQAQSQLILFPQNLFINRFNNFCRDLFNLKNLFFNQIDALENIRDALLPKIMSGKIRVKVPETEATV